MSRPKGLTKWLRTAGPIDTLYGVRHWRNEGPILLVNGESGVWAADAAGLDACCTCIGEGADLRPGALATLQTLPDNTYSFDSSSSNNCLGNRQTSL
jgi:hypothetical protein